MKKYLINFPVPILFFCFVFSIPSAFSQTSYEFGLPVPIETVAVNSVGLQYSGLYESESSQLKYEVSHKGIFIHTINIQAISRETIRESGKYEVRNEHIFGVTEDSIPCILEGDNYFFGIRSSVQLIGNESENQLIPNDNIGTYILNFKTDNGYTPALLEFRNNQLNISYFDYNSNDNPFNKVKEKKVLQSDENNLTTIVLLPTLREWQKISKKELFGEVYIFRKELSGNN